MSPSFYGLLDDALAEIRLRGANYPSAFPIHVAQHELVSRYREHPLCSRFSAEALSGALASGFDYLGRWQRIVLREDSADDPVARFVGDSIIDAFCAEERQLALQPYRGPERAIARVRAEDYTERSTPAGVRYYVRNRGRCPLVLINATGTPITIWSRFLADAEHDLKVIVPQRRGTDPLVGGARQRTDIATEAADLESILDAESIEQVVVLGWCNGANLAVDLANRRTAQVSALVLLGPMFKGIKSVAASSSSFERDLQPLLDAVRDKSELAPMLSKAIVQRTTPPDWARSTAPPPARAKLLFALPAKALACEMLAPIADPESLLNTAHRVASDQSYPMDAALANLRVRTMIVQGSDDSVVSNQLARAAVDTMCRNAVVTVVLSGSGHYIQHLQYPYFRWLLHEFLDARRAPPQTARAWVQCRVGAMGHNG
jgi:pimeloyl-ACP methyl ester carboxylesterase